MKSDEDQLASAPRATGDDPRLRAREQARERQRESAGGRAAAGGERAGVLSRRSLLAAALATPLAACARPAPEAPAAAPPAAAAEPGAAAGPVSAPQGSAVVVLGTAQDAGVPQVDCFRDHCARVRRGEAPAPRVASLGIVDPEAGRRFLIDATPDFVAQVQDLLAVPLPGSPAPSGEVVRLEEHLHGVLLTHAHMGHYTGLVHCGREAAATRGLPLYASAAMHAYLAANEPWASLLAGDFVQPVRLEPQRRLELTAALRLTPLHVVHRGELSDTLGYLVEGPRRSLLYVPDADRWDAWPVPFDDWLGRCDVALLDGSFWSGVELGHRPQDEVPHPPVSLTIERLAARASRPDVWFIHLNHTNPLWDPQGAERAALEAGGFGIATRGQVFDL